jgi:outer membrane lipoprotein-sorting protein
VVIACGGTAIALAATGAGPVPPPKPLAVAAHDALSAPAPPGITARVEFKNHLISSDTVAGADPILTGAAGRLWLTRGHFRLELQSDRGDAQVVVDGKRFWVYDPRSNTVYRGDVPGGLQTDGHDSKDVPSVAEIRRFLERLMKHVDVSAAIPSDVAGHATYTVRVSPRKQGGMLAGGELAWDAVRGVPLEIGIFAKGGSSPVLELTATNVSYGSVPASTFDVSPPPGAKVVAVSIPTKPHEGADHEQAPVTGAGAVGKAAPFPLSAPGTLAGLPRQEVRLVQWGGHPAALVTYGQNLDGIAVLEQEAGAGNPIGTAPGADTGGDHGGLNLPSVSIGGVTGQELPTALGTIVRFERDGVAFTVAGSVPAAKAEAAARGL